MKTIWKFPLETTDSQEIQMPVGINLLDIQIQYKSPNLWGIVDTEAKKEVRTIKIFGTGSEIPKDFYLSEWIYLGSYQILSYSNLLVFHAFINNDNFVNSKL